MPDNKVDQKFTDRSAKEFSESIESGKLYEELKKKDSEKNDDGDNSDSENRNRK
ncbi:MAG: hypothetical protein IPL26_08675 [Leptospiraceae bacterium]|nr:hypothetical protein [Leptospiraceae bacterium]